MHTISTDKQKRVRLPDAKPGQIFAYEVQGDTITLTAVKKAQVKEPFPEGSLRRYAEERDEEFERFVGKTVVGVPQESAD